jgi:hypothetical protein
VASLSSKRERSVTGRVRPSLPSALAATWRSGYAAACKAVYTGSIPVVASERNAC